MIEIGQGSSASPSLCIASSTAWYGQDWESLLFVLRQFSPAQLVASWLVMLIAMMTPILVNPFRHLWIGSLVRRRWRAISLFLLAYLVVWMTAGGLLVLLAVALKGFDVSLGVPMGVTALGLALFWQSTPAKQYCLNRCHWLPRLSAFGWAADRDCLRFGLINAGWCVATCWALMLLPLVASAAHLMAMLVVSIAMIFERLRPARGLRWSNPFLIGLRG